MPTAHLTDIVVSRLKTAGIYYDTTTTAFGIRVGKRRKAWVVTRGTDRQRITLGLYPTMSLAEARKEAKKLLSQEPNRPGKVSITEAYEGWKQTFATKRPTTQAGYTRIMDKYFVPNFGTSRIV